MNIGHFLGDKSLIFKLSKEKNFLFLFNNSSYLFLFY
jgi:hypothetical protein